MDEAKKDRRIEVARIVFLAVSIILVAIWPERLGPLAVAAVLIGGFPVFKEAVTDAKAGRLHMESAMALGMIASAAIGELLAATVIAFFTLVAELLESLTYEKSRQAIKELVRLYPKNVTRKTDSGEEEVPLEAIAVGDVVIVKSGQRIAVDGIVEGGEASVDESPVTGESVPVDKLRGDRVFAGTVNAIGTLEIRVDKLGSDTTLGRIISLVERAEESKAHVQKFADTFASKFVPAILILALAVFLLTKNPRIAIATVVVACPCAIAMATPLAVVASVGRAAKGGIIIKGGMCLEELGKVDSVVFDKTGTLTMGELSVTDYRGFEEYSDEDVLRTAASAEKHSEHPIGRAILKKARELGIEIPEHPSCKVLAGKGVVCQLDGRQIIMGNRKLMAEKRISIASEVEAYMTEQETAGKTPVLLASEGRVWGIVCMADRMRADAPIALKELRSLGIRKIMIMTGDNPRTAAEIAKGVGIPIEDVIAEMMPEQKASKVKELMASRFRVMMVGDGINDAPALAQSSVGVAMGAAGVTAALEAAHVALMTNDFRNIPEAIKIGRRAFAVIKQNVTVSIAFNAVGISLAAAGILSPLMAAVAHVIPDIFLFINSSRLLVHE